MDAPADEALQAPTASRAAPMLAAIVNHGHTAGVRALRAALEPHVATWAVDSGSPLGDAERGAFDRCVDNIYYSGLLNLAHGEARQRGAATLLFVCSDITVADGRSLVRRARAALADDSVGLWAPSMSLSAHPHMRRGRTHGLRPVPFVEGACFAVRASLLAEVCPVDTQANALGWGVDVALGYQAWRAGLRAVVDDSVPVVHGGVCGYDRRAARQQRDAWFARQNVQARRFRWITGMEWVKTGPGWWLARRWLL